MLTTIHIIPTTTTLFQYYHTIIYLLLCTIPLAMFLAFRILNLSWLTAGLAAFFALLISTDGLYGIDQTSFLWRGWGLSSQLFALIWFPLAIASAIQYTISKEHKKRNLILTTIFLTATTAGHLGIGMMAWMAVAVIAFSPVIFQFFDKHSIKELLRQGTGSIKQTVLLILPTFILLSYWIIPVFIGGAYHNTSVWDPIWKFNSFGVIEVMTKLAGGALFDFGRLPIMTIAIILGMFVVWTTDKETKKQIQPFGVLFLFFLVLFFGRTTWGGLIDLIPGMSDFHGHRFIVGLHVASLFLAPIGAMWLIEEIFNLQFLIFNKFFKFQISNSCLPARQVKLLYIGSYLFIGLLAYFSLVPQIISYATYNDTLIAQGNTAYDEAKPDMDLLLATLKNLETTNPGRVYALRGGEGSNFKIASSPYYMQLSTFGIPTVLWLPETWSPNSDTEQFFTEENPVHYNLYNIKYVVTPPDKVPQKFWKQITKTAHWVLYEVETSGYSAVGYSPSVVGSKKTDFINLVHLWIQSADLKNEIFPQLSITKKVNNITTLPHFQMTDPVSYITPDNKKHSLFAEPPLYIDTTKKIEIPPMKILSQSGQQDMVFQTTIEVTDTCPTCVVVLKQTYHPNWKATINGKQTTVIEVFPSYVAVRLEQPGVYTVTFSYEPSKIKLFLCLAGLLIVSIGMVVMLRKK